MGWVDTRWEPGRGRGLVRLLARQYNNPVKVENLLIAAGIGLEEMLATTGSMELYWNELARNLNDKQLLGRLLDEVAAQWPLLVPELTTLKQAQVMAVLPAGGAGNKYDVYLLNPGRRPFINRSDLRQRLKELLEENYPVLIVRGPDGCGKSFSYRLLEQVTPPGVQPLHVDFSSPGSGDRARDLMEIISARMGIELRRPSGRRTTDVRHANELVDDLVGKYNEVDRRPRILVIDGLNRIDLAKDVGHLVARLIAEVSNNQLPGIQLVLLGYSETYDQQFQPVVLVEDVAGITPTHIEAFFTKLGEADGHQLSENEVKDLAARALRDSPPLYQLPQRVMTEWRQLVGAGS